MAAKDIEGRIPPRPPRPWPSDEELIAAGWVKISRRERIITSVPRVGAYYWLDLPHDNYEPEFVDEHPCIVVRAARRLHDTCIVVPLTTRPHEDAKHIHKLARNPNPQGRREGKECWAICDHLYTVHLARFRPILDRYGNHDRITATPEDLHGIFKAIRAALHRVFEEPVPSASEAREETTPSRPLGPNTLTLPKKPPDA